MIRQKTERSEIVIDLTGPDGNAFNLLAQANALSRQLGLDADKITSEMKEGNYENLVQTFDNYFGEYVTLER